MKYDIFGDIHGCYEEMVQLFSKLGYQKVNHTYVHPERRVPVFVGDLTDRGPQSLDVIRFVHRLVVIEKRGIYVIGNHCNKLYRYFLGNPVKITHGLETTVSELNELTHEEYKDVEQKFFELYEQGHYYYLDNEHDLIVAHAGIREEYIGKLNNQTKSFVLYGETTGELDQNGRPIRMDWAKKYKGQAFVVYGHTPVKEPRVLNQTINIDTGCVFGNRLTAFRYPENQTVSVASMQPLQNDRFTHYE